MTRHKSMRSFAVLVTGVALSITGVSSALAQEAGQPETQEVTINELGGLCTPDYWSFVITDVSDETSPDEITVHFVGVADESETNDVVSAFDSLYDADEDGAEDDAIYFVDDVDPAVWTLDDAVAVVPADWEGDFVFLEGPEFCTDEEPTPTESPEPSESAAPKPPIKKIVTGVADSEAAASPALLAGAALLFVVTAGMAVTIGFRREH